MTNAMSDDRERMLNGDWIVYNVADDENFDLTGSKIAILTEKQREQMYYNNVEPERIRDLETYDLHTLVMWAINEGFVAADRTRYSGPQREVFVVTFPLLEHPGQTFAVVLDRGDEMRGYSEAEAKNDVLSELETCDLEESDDYPKDIDLDEGSCYLPPAGGGGGRGGNKVVCQRFLVGVRPPATLQEGQPTRLAFFVDSGGQA